MLAFDELPTDLQDVLADWPARRAVSRKDSAMNNPVNAANTTVDWSQLHEELARPFPDTAIKYRIGTVSKDKKTAQALPYVDPRAYEDRLNALVPGFWSVSFEPWGTDRIICRLTIHGVTRSSTGEGTGSPVQVAGTAAEAQAFKRAASKFGLGRHLYSLHVRWMDYDAKSKSIRPRQPTSSPLPDSGELQPRNQAPAASQESDAPETLGRARAATMHRELARLGLPRSKHPAFAREVLGRPVQNLSGLAEGDARLVWRAATRRYPTRTPSL